MNKRFTNKRKYKNTGMAKRFYYSKNRQDWMNKFKWVLNK